ncbi:MAG: esterase/lipase family protein [Pirellulaceae bacterium]
MGRLLVIFRWFETKKGTFCFSQVGDLGVSQRRGEKQNVPFLLCRLGLIMAFVAGMVAPVTAQESSDERPVEQGIASPNLASPTLGGKQLWSDELVFHDWRIQRNAWTGHFRLLDDKNVRRAWGTFAHCRGRLDEYKRERQLPPLQPRVILVVHGLVRSRSSMSGLCEYLREHTEKTTVLNVSYASSRESLREHAASLAKVIGHLEGIQQIDLVAHSLGNLVIRHYLADRQQIPAGSQPQPRVHRIVMLAPPNNGAALAEQFRNNTLFQTIWGTSGLELAKKWTSVEKHLAIPDCQFGIIAGGTGQDGGRNPLLQGDDDMIVSVAETRLRGAYDFVVVPALHSMIMDHSKAREYTLRFLEYGYFLEESKRCPIPAER